MVPILSLLLFILLIIAVPWWVATIVGCFLGYNLWCKYNNTPPFWSTKHPWRSKLSLTSAQQVSHLRYTKVANRDEFRKFVHKRRVNNFLNTIVISELEDGRTVGASVVFESETLRLNKRLIKNKQINRNDYERQITYIPGRDSVRGQYTLSSSGRRMSHYHSTHLIPFRLCLSESGNLQLTGTTALNTGSRPTKHWYIPTEATFKRADYIVKKTKYRPNYFMKERRVPKSCDGKNAPGDNFFSLNDFECAIDAIVFSKTTPYHNVWKYSTECYYESDSPIPSYVIVELFDVSKGRKVFRARINNRL